MTIAEHVDGVPAPHLRRYVRQYLGYHYRGFAPGVHLGLPSPDLTVVISFEEPTLVSLTPDHAPSGYTALASGLTMAPAFIHHDGTQFGVQLALTPAGARALFGMPAAALAAAVAPLSLEPLTDRLRAASWPRRFALLDEALNRRLDPVEPAPELAFAWRRIMRSGGALRVGALAAETGWSRRHLCARFAAEFGVGPKDALRLVRFGRSTRLVREPHRRALADIAAACGYYDQAHLAREWREFAGVAPSHWAQSEELPILPSHDEVEAATLEA
ncbi:AraC family transcriptional regulator [Catellatospora citrea]|uniref:AraC family transcriptional regulator n=1 Tax=Catellatospora citrea TaxID=53366 RepID=A0A8J3KCA4_9ACTN|nr:helix-turn-helix domain-containing protein [Catellatospora citrea]RKE10958.1 AraC family transcriptional regulator [Catellatospora citrea]GIF96413.1 AraC family transcriptional regulator [Catellatospora citrea]